MTGTAELTWLGHASVLIEMGGVRLLTDPLLTQKVAHLRRRIPLPQLPDVDAVLLSHVHMDHLHLPSLRRVARGKRLIVPAGARPLVASLSDDIDEVMPGDTVTISPASGDRARTDTEHRAEQPGGTVTVRVVHAEHLHGRGPHSRIRAHPVGYVVQHEGTSAYFAGDTDLFDAMSDLGPLDVALLPIWGWGPTLGEKHLNPESAAEATERIGPRVVVPIHWGTYSPVTPRRRAPAWIDRPSSTFAEHLARRGLADALRTVQPGGSLRWSNGDEIGHSGRGA